MASEAKNLIGHRSRSKPGYPIELRLGQQLVVIIGGGPVTRRKLPDLVTAGAIIHLIDPEPLSKLPQHPQLIHFQRAYQPADLDSARLVFAATSDTPLNAQIALNAKERGILCCRVDSAEDSDFISPARLQRPPLSFTLSSGGESPAILPVLRDLLDELIPASWQTATELAAAIRRKVLTAQPLISYNQQVLLKLIDQGLLALIESSDQRGLDRLLLEHFGAGFTLKDLQFQLPEGTP